MAASVIQGRASDRRLSPPRRPLEEAIELRVNAVEELFHSLDPLSSPTRNLDARVEDYVVDWAREVRGDRPIRLVIHVPPNAVSDEIEKDIASSISDYFSSSAASTEGDLKLLFRQGRISIVIGLAVLIVCIVVGQAVGGRIGGGYLQRFFDEALIILSSVANWRPIQIFLYDWWPLVERRNLYHRLSAAKVSFRSREDRTVLPSARKPYPKPANSNVVVAAP